MEKSQSSWRFPGLAFASGLTVESLESILPSPLRISSTLRALAAYLEQLFQNTYIQKLWIFSSEIIFPPPPGFRAGTTGPYPTSSADIDPTGNVWLHLTPPTAFPQRNISKPSWFCLRCTWNAFPLCSPIAASGDLQHLFFRGRSATASLLFSGLAIRHHSQHVKFGLKYKTSFSP